MPSRILAQLWNLNVSLELPNGKQVQPGVPNAPGYSYDNRPAVSYNDGVNAGQLLRFTIPEVAGTYTLMLQNTRDYEDGASDDGSTVTIPITVPAFTTSN